MSLQQLAHDLELNGAHELQPYLLRPLVPGNAQLWVLLGQLAQGHEHRMAVRALAGLHAVGQDRCQHGRLARGLGAQHVSRAHMAKARDRAGAPGGNLACELEPLAGVDAQLVGLLGPCLASIDARELLLCTKRAARDLEPAETLAALVAHAVDANGKRGGPAGLRPQGNQGVEQLGDALVLERRAKQNGEDTPFAHEPREGGEREHARLEIFVEGRLVGCGGCLEGVAGVVAVLAHERGRIDELAAVCGKVGAQACEHLRARLGRVAVWQ